MVLLHFKTHSFLFNLFRIFLGSKEIETPLSPWEGILRELSFVLLLKGLDGPRER